MAITKTEGDGEQHPAGHYLVIEDPEHPSTWHLRVKGPDGKPDHTLMGAAWAALHGGYRGNTYQGPGKEEALRKLKAMYAAEGMETPKADDLPPMVATVKAAGDWELDVLVPYGSPAAKDSDGEYFDAATNFHLDKYTPPAVYYHGYGADKRPEGQPVYLGRTIDSREEPGVGRWLRVKLDQAIAQARRLWEHVKGGGQLVSSSGSIAHLVRRAKDGRIIEWPLAEISIWEHDPARPQANTHAVAVPVLKMMYEQAGIALPDDIAEPTAGTEGADAQSVTGTATQQQITVKEHKTMDANEMQAAVDAAVKAALDKRAEEEAAAKREADTAALKAEVEALRAKVAEAGRLPTVKGMPYVTQFNDTKYDNLDHNDMAFMFGVLDAPTNGVKADFTRDGKPKFEDRETALKSLAAKIIEAEGKGSTSAHVGHRALKAAGFKADELNRSTLSSYGDQWVGVAYSQNLWEKIRAGSFVVSRLPAIEVPQGFESITIPLESGDPLFYNVGQAADLAATTAVEPVATMLTSRVGTANKSLTVGKMGARVLWTGEMDEDSLIPWVSNLRRQMELAGANQMEYAIIDGDTVTATSNINDSGASAPTAGDLFLICDGFRKLPLITNTANKVDLGTLASDDFLKVVKLMGAAGMNAANKNAVEFIIDPWTHYKALELVEVKTRDVFVAPTIENGVLTGIYGHKINVSYNICAAGVYLGTVTTDTYKFLSNASGEIDQDTESNNTKGSILAVRWDQWLLGWKRRMTMEVTRFPRSDSSEIVALARWGLAYRDNEASALGYDVTV